MAHRPKKEAWYHSRMVDWMIANPDGRLKDLAAFIGRTPTTVSMIVNSDMFKAMMNERKAQFQQRHDFGLIQKTTQIANASLDAIIETLDKKRDKIPLESLRDISNDALSRLGYGTKPEAGAGTQVHIHNSATAQVVVPVSQSDLQEARMVLRAVQDSRTRAVAPPAPTLDIDALLAPTSEAGLVNEEDAESAPANIPS